MADTPTTMPKDQAIAAQKAALPKLLVPATMGDLGELLWDYAQKAVPVQKGSVTPQEKKISEEIDAIRALNAHAGRGEAVHNRAYFHAVLSFIERYSVGEQEKLKANQLAALLDVDEKKRAVALAKEGDAAAKEIAAAMTDYKTGATQNGEAFTKKVVGFFGAVVETAKGAAADAPGAAEQAKNAFQQFMNTLSAGGILGGVLGLAGAWLLGGFFGEGMFSTILMVTLAFPLVMIGSKWGKETIDGWLNSKPAPRAQGPEQQRAADAGKSAQKQVFTEAELNAMLASVKPGERTDAVRLYNDPQNKQVALRTVKLDDTNPEGIQTVAALQGALAECKASGFDGIVFSPVQGGAQPRCGRAR